MDKVEAAHIAYAAVLARFGISSQSRWSEKDGHFNYRNFYYVIMDLINECKDVEWKEGLLKHFNMLFFRNKEGQGSDLKAKDDDSAPTSTSKKGGFLSRMRVQAAARVANTTKSESSSVITNDTPAETSLASPRVPEVVKTSERQLPPQLSLQVSLSPRVALPRVTEMVDTSKRQLPPRLESLQESSFLSVSAPHAQVPVTITPVDTTTLNPPSELSKIEPDEESGRRKSSASKGKQKVNGQNSEGGPSKRRSGRKKAGNNA